MILQKSARYLAIFALIIGAGCNDPAERTTASALPPLEVQIETLAESLVPIQVELAGTVQAIEHATISRRSSMFAPPPRGRASLPFR